MLELWDRAGYREERHAALELTGHRLHRRFQDPEALPVDRHLVRTGAWWDLVDPVATRRVGHGPSTDLTLLRDVLVANLEGSRHGSQCFVRKAIGWALRQHARTDPAWVRALVSDHHHRLSGLSRREGLKHL